MLSLHDLRSPAVAMDWHEAVAVAAALAAWIVDAQAGGGEAACPHPEDTMLLPTGALQVVSGRRLAAPAAQGVAQVLGQLLAASPCPAELRQLVDRFQGGGPEPAADAPAALLARLAFFERPGRTDVLAALAARAAPLVEQARRTAALDALTERTRQAADEPAPRGLAAIFTGSVSPPSPATVTPHPDEPPGDWVAAAPPAARWLVPAALALVAFVAAASMASWWLAPAAAPAQVRQEEDLPIEGSAAPRPAPAPASGAAAGRRVQAPPRPGSATRATPSAAESTATPPAAEPVTPSAPMAAEAAPAPSAVRSTGDIDVIVAERDGRVIPAAGSPVRPAGSPPGRVYTAADPQVTPAILIRPHLPAQPPPDVPEEQIGTLEFVVAESGAVEHVHLISPANRFQERMLVAAAKTWQFQPATRDGRPVRYRTRVRVTL